MELKELIEKQKQFDEQHGWVLENDNVQGVLDAINKDLVGLFGEVGEFANLVKKVNLTAERQSADETVQTYYHFKDKLSEELIDSLIYLFRISTHLNIDITSMYLKKLNYNKNRYKKYEK